MSKLPAESVTKEPVDTTKAPAVCLKRVVDVYSAEAIKTGTKDEIADAGFLYVGKLVRGGADVKRWIAADAVYGKDGWMTVAKETPLGTVLGTVTKVGLGPRAGQTVWGPGDVCEAQVAKWAAAGWFLAEAAPK